MAIDWSKDELGALWKKKGKSGKVFLSGYVETQDDFGNKKRVRLIVFPNKFKEDGDNKPDFNIYKGEEDFSDGGGKPSRSRGSSQKQARSSERSEDPPANTSPETDQDGFEDDGVPTTL